MFARIGVVEDDVDDLAALEDEGVGVGAVDGGVGGGGAGAEGSEKGRDFGADVGDVVEEGAEGGEVSEGRIGRGEKGLLVRSVA